MKTKNFLFSLLLVGAAGVTGAQAETPKKLAVLVVGIENDAKSDDFAARLGSDLNRDGGYDLQTKDNNSAVADKLAALRAAHTVTTPADTTGLAAWGKANGIDFVQLVVQSPPISFLKTVRTAQLVNCGTGNLSGRGTYSMEFLPKGVDPTTVVDMVPVTGGVFEMGCKSSRDGTCGTGETPLHYVKVNDFSIGRYAVTQAVWRGVMGWLPSNIPSDYKGDSKPVIYVSYNEIVHLDTGFLAKLNALTRESYRLPTEAEWEYAARGCDGGVCEDFEYSGDKTIGDVAWYRISDYSYPNGPQPVGGKAANKLGIYDMSGNVFEWCSDWYSATYYPSNTTLSVPQDNPTGPETPGSPRVIRGGSWNNDASNCRVADRGSNAPGNSDAYIGFRLVLP
jgi:formylglycine-generating enzyme required for sulfatase activity